MEDSIYLTFFGVATFIVYVAIFPAMQAGYKALTKRRSISPFEPEIQEAEAPLLESAPSGDQEEEEAGGKEEKDPGTVWRDINFFLFGAVLYAIGFAVVPIFHKAIILFICKSRRAIHGFFHYLAEGWMVRHYLI